MPPEQIQLGGSYTVRGYDEGLIIGDVGYITSVELRRSLGFLPDFNIPYWKNKKIPVNLKDRIQVAAFYDHGYTKAIHQGQDTTYANFLNGVGVGLRCYISKFVSANLDLGIPLGKQRSEDQKAVRFHFGLSSNLF